MTTKNAGRDDSNSPSKGSGRVAATDSTAFPQAGFLLRQGAGGPAGQALRGRADEALHRAEENFRRSLDESPLGVRIVTSEGETIYANRAILGIYGYDSIEELNTTPIQKRYTRESYDEFRIRREKRRQGVDVPSEYTIGIIRKNGDVRHLRVYRKEILWDDERQFQVIYQDITEHKRAEEALVAKSSQLEESNTALRVLLQYVKEDQQKIEMRIMANIRKLVLPNLEKLRGLNLNDPQASCLDIITANLQQVTSLFLQNLATCFADFTPREIQVADMIRQGKTSKEIAYIFRVSIRSVDFHRDNIRKKLGLNHKKTNLRAFLMKLS
jgi:PAS domain S-box-containing protein